MKMWGGRQVQFFCKFTAMMCWKNPWGAPGLETQTHLPVVGRVYIQKRHQPPRAPPVFHEDRKLVCLVAVPMPKLQTVQCKYLTDVPDDVLVIVMKIVHTSLVVSGWSFAVACKRLHALVPRAEFRELKIMDHCRTIVVQHVTQDLKGCYHAVDLDNRAASCGELRAREFWHEEYGQPDPNDDTMEVWNFRGAESLFFKKLFPTMTNVYFSVRDSTDGYDCEWHPIFAPTAIVRCSRGLRQRMHFQRMNPVRGSLHFGAMHVEFTLDLYLFNYGAAGPGRVVGEPMVGSCNAQIQRLTLAKFNPRAPNTHHTNESFNLAKKVGRLPSMWPRRARRNRRPSRK